MKLSELFKSGAVKESMNADEKAAFSKANEQMHAIEDQWHYPILKKHGFKSDTTAQKGFVRSYNYKHPDGREIKVTTGASSDYWEDKKTGNRGYWADLEPHIKKTAVKEAHEQSYEFPSFSSWLYRSKIASESDIDALVDTAYDKDTHTQWIVSEVGSKKKPTLEKLEKEITTRAKWTVQDSKSPAAKKILAAVPKYAKDHAANILKHWDAWSD